VVGGRVQGVFFRATTRDRATALGLSGWVNNRDDGRVEVVVCGDEASLATFKAWLWDGPSGARVNEVSCQPAPDEGLQDFTIAYR
jgi:acylphosphatase